MLRSEEARRWFSESDKEERGEGGRTVRRWAERIIEHDMLYMRSGNQITVNARVKRAQCPCSVSLFPCRLQARHMLG